MENFENDMHELARMFMYQFFQLESMSLDEFLSQYSTVLTDEQKELGHHILEMFNYIKY